MSDMLSVDQLPAFVKMYNHDIPVQYLRLETQLATLINGDSFLRDLLTTGGNNHFVLAIYGRIYNCNYFVEELLLFI